MVDAESGCVCRVEPNSGGVWRRGEFVIWTDLFVFVEAMLVWLGLLVVVMVAVSGTLIAQHIAPADLGARLAGFTQTTQFHFAMTMTIYLVMLFFFGRVAARVADRALGARFRAVRWPVMTIAVLTGMLLAVLVPLLTAILTQYHLIDLAPTKSELRLIPHTPGEWAMAVVTIGLVAPLTEELYFRGIVLGWLMKRMGALGAILVSGIVFALVHFNFIEHHGASGLYVTGVIAVVGFATAFAAIKTGSLWPAFGIHSGYNTVLISLPLLQTLLR